MKLNIYTVGSFQMIRIEEDLNIISDLHELSFLIEGYIEQGKNRIAVSFPNVSYIYSGAIAVLLQCLKKIQSKKGDLCIIEQNPEIKNIFNVLQLNKLITIYESEEMLEMA
jgi:anti-anti-sigma factor